MKFFPVSAGRAWRHNVVALGLGLLLSACGDGGSDAPKVDAGAIQKTLSSARGTDPGMAGAWVTDEAIVLAADGVVRAGTTTPLSTDMWYHLASGEKAVAAMAVAVYVERGKLRWDTTLAEIFPELSTTMQPALKSATVEQVLAHRSGMIQLFNLPDFYQVPPLTGDVMSQRAGFVAWATAQETVGLPGKQFAYSNAGYITVAAILERIGGKPYEDLVGELVLKPLRLRYAFSSPIKIAGTQPFGHLLNEAGQQIPQDLDSPYEQIPDWMHPAGIFSMPLADYARFAQIHLQSLRGNPILLKAETYRKLHTSLGPLVDDQPSLSYLGIGLGWGTESTGTGSISYFVGSLDYYQSAIVIDPQRNRAAVLFATYDISAKSGSFMQDTVRSIAALVP